MLTSRERVNLAVNHKEPDRVPLDLGGFIGTGMHVDLVYSLRQALGLDPPGTPVKVIEPFQMLGEIDLDLTNAVGSDVVALEGPGTQFGFNKEGWKPWTTFAGTPVLVPEGFNTEPDPSGDILMYPEGDRSAPASGRMPKGGFYFDAIVRQPPLDDENLNPEDNTVEFSLISDKTLDYLKNEVERLYNRTDKALLGAFGGTSFGSMGNLPATWVKYPKGIRKPDEWFMSHLIRRDYLYKAFERQCAIGLENFKRIYEVVGDRIVGVVVTTTDFGMQTGPFISPKIYRDLYMPFHQRLNDWVHQNTPWKTFIHSCGSVREFLPDFIAAGFDLLNPVQCSAAHMAPEELKKEYGDRITFWGGGVDTQKTLPFGTPDDVRRQVRERLRILGLGGGFVFATVHNIQARTPVENVLAMIETVRDYGKYPLT